MNGTATKDSVTVPRAATRVLANVQLGLGLPAGILARLDRLRACLGVPRGRVVELALTGQSASSKLIATAAENAGAELSSINADIHASEEYRRAMIPVFTRRAVAAALARS